MAVERAHYRKHFALTRLPFETPAETDELLESNARREFEARLGHFIDLCGIGLLADEVGPGKTTVCRHLTAGLYLGLHRVHYSPEHIPAIMDACRIDGGRDRSLYDTSSRTTFWTS